jgi:hypothetical protein
MTQGVPVVTETGPVSERRSRPSVPVSLCAGRENAAVDGVATIIHCAGTNKGGDIATQDLVDAAARSDRPHLVYISVLAQSGCRSADGSTG